MPNVAVYAASKAALNSFGMSLRAELQVCTHARAR
jgi:short-subunit dehydrogenase